MLNGNGPTMDGNRATTFFGKVWRRTSVVGTDHLFGDETTNQSKTTLRRKYRHRYQGNNLRGVELYHPGIQPLRWKVNRNPAAGKKAFWKQEVNDLESNLRRRGR